MGGTTTLGPLCRSRTDQPIDSGTLCRDATPPPGPRVQIASPRLRLPTIEVFSALSGGAFASRGRGLSPSEVQAAREIFGASLNLDVVRIVETGVVNAPTTLGNHIRVSPGVAACHGDAAFQQNTCYKNRNGTNICCVVLIHELTHVWQFQTKGTAYISDSLWHQTVATITTGDRNTAYELPATLDPSWTIDNYTAEQQAMIVEKFYSDPTKRSDPQYQRLIEQVRRARPLPTSLVIEEAAFGPGGRNNSMLRPLGDPPPFHPEGMVPLFRVEF